MIPNWQIAELEAALYPLAKEAGAKDVRRVVAGVVMAVSRGEDADEMLESLRRNQPNLFYPVRPTIERKREKKAAKDGGEYSRWV